MISISTVLDSREVNAFLSGLPNKIDKVQRSATTRTTTFAKNEMEKRLAAKTGIKRALLKKYRVKRRVNAQLGIVWVGYNPIKAAYVGKLEQLEGGAMAGQYYFQGGFIARMQEGHAGIFKRFGAKKLMTKGRYKGQKRQPIVEQRVTLPNVLEEAREVADLSGAEFARLFNERMQL